MYKKILILLIVLLVLSTPVTAYNKQLNQDTNTLYIKQTVTNNTLFTIQQVSSNPGLTTMEEVFNITSYIASDYTFNAGDIGFSWKKLLGVNNITGTDFYLFKQNNYSILVDDYSYPWQNTSSMIPCGFLNLSSCEVWNNITIQTLVGNHTEIRDNSSWIKLNNLNGKVIKSGKSYLIKVIFHKVAETGSFAIRTIPSFVGVEEDRMTWWNGSYKYSYNDPKVDAVIPYQFSLNISNNTVPFGNTTHVNITCYQNNCTDIRFLLDNTTEVPYWRDTNTSINGSGYGTFWVNVTGNGSIQIYSGATGMSDASNGTNTFEFFGDTLAKWTITGNVVLTDGVFVMSGNGIWNQNGMVGITAIARPAILEWEEKASTINVDTEMGYGNSLTINTYSKIYLGAGGNKIYIYDEEGAAGQTTYAANIYASSRLVVLPTQSYDVYNNGVQFDTYIGAATDTNWKMMFNTLTPGQTVTIKNARVRKYASPEPTWATWGQAETQLIINITSWGNNKTNDLNLNIAFNTTDNVLFNATANQTIDTWSWFKDNIDQSNNLNNISINFTTAGIHTVKVNASNAIGTSNTITWTATITVPTYITREILIRVNQLNWSAVPGDSYGFVCAFSNRTVYINTTGCTQP